MFISKELGSDCIEIHKVDCEPIKSKNYQKEFKLKDIKIKIILLEVHVGHGLDYNY